MIFEPHITYLHDDDVDAALDLKLRQLISTSFEQTPLMDKRYFNEMPQHRWIVKAGDELAAHLAVHEKVFRVKDREEPFIGIAEVCVAQSYRGQGLVRKLLAQAEAFFELDYSILLGDERVYGSSHYFRVHNIIFPDVSAEPRDDVLVKCLNAKPWFQQIATISGPTF